VSVPEFDLTDGARLRPLTEADADELYELVDANRAYLARWMPWAEAQTRAGTLEFIRMTAEQAATDRGFQVAVTVEGRMAGLVGYHALDRDNRRVSIGYWRVEIRSAVNNSRSRALCERLGLVEEGLLREAEAFTDRYHDLVVYSVLAPEWAQRRRG
jgi:ribosomal-protein-serine acetyltransferase